jgi:hypothetical protein
MKVLKRTIGLLLTAAVAAMTAGCGSDDKGKPIPQDAAAALERQLASIQARFEVGGGACGDITGGDDPNSTPVRQTIDSLPDDVDPDVRDALQGSFDRLFQLVEEQCKSEPPPQQQQQQQQQQQTETEQAPSQTETTPAETTETETTPTQTEEQPPPETNPNEKVPPGQEKKQGQTGQPQGNGDGDGDGGALVPENGG